MDPVTTKMALQLGISLARSKTLKRIMIGVSLLLVFALGTIVLGPSAIISQSFGNETAQTQMGADTSCLAATVPASAQWSMEQATDAKAIWTVAHSMNMGDRGAVVGITTSLQESGLRNLTYGDRDSVGLFQQRASWGTVDVRTNPEASSRLFFAALAKVPGWQQLPAGVAAQRVQISAYPDAYAKWETDAAQLVAKMSGTAQPAACTDQQGSAGGGAVPATFNSQGNPRTVEQAIAYLTSDRPRGIPGYSVLGHCEGYMTRGYGNPGGYPTAISHWNAPGPRTAGMSVPPRGAIVFWRTSNPAGHVALSLGNGIIMSTDFNGTRYQPGMLSVGPISAIDAWGPRLGWRAPNFHPGSGR